MSKVYIFVGLLYIVLAFLAVVEKSVPEENLIYIWLPYIKALVYFIAGVIYVIMGLISDAH